MLLAFLNSLLNMMEDVTREIDILFIDQIPYKVSMVLEDLISASLSRG